MDQQSRQKAPRAYCPNIYILCLWSPLPLSVLFPLALCTGGTSSAEPALSTVQQSDRSAGLAAAVLEARAELEQSGSQYIAASNYSA